MGSVRRMVQEKIAKIENESLRMSSQESRRYCQVADQRAHEMLRHVANVVMRMQKDLRELKIAIPAKGQ